MDEKRKRSNLEAKGKISQVEAYVVQVQLINQSITDTRVAALERIGSERRLNVD